MSETTETRPSVKFSGVVEGHDALVLAQLLRDATASADGHAPTLVHVARDDRRLDALERGLQFFAPKIRKISIPAWDTVPYDRIGPNADIVAKRMTSFARLALAAGKEPVIVLTTVNSVVQRLPPREFVRKSMRQLAPGQRIDMNRLMLRLTNGGFSAPARLWKPASSPCAVVSWTSFHPGEARRSGLIFWRYA